MWLFWRCNVSPWWILWKMFRLSTHCDSLSNGTVSTSLYVKFWSESHCAKLVRAEGRSNICSMEIVSVQGNGEAWSGVETCLSRLSMPACIKCLFDHRLKREQKRGVSCWWTLGKAERVDCVYAGTFGVVKILNECWVQTLISWVVVFFGEKEMQSLQCLSLTAKPAD